MDVKGELKGEVVVDAKGTQTLIDAALELFSPATELIGLLGDAVRLARVEVATLITKRAKNIADTNGIVLTAPPLKFLAPFYEKASLEDVDDHEAHGRWAELLVAASTSTGAHPRFISLMSEIEGAQARFLKEVFAGRNLDEVHRSLRAKRFDAVRQEFTLSTIEEIVFEIERRFPDHPLQTLVDTLNFHLNGPGIFIARYQISQAGLESYPYRGGVRRGVPEAVVDWEVLHSLGLLDRHYYSGFVNLPNTTTSTHLEMEVITMSVLGIQFLRCWDPHVRDVINSSFLKAKDRTA
ncbi:MAG: hypothetical protein QM773_20085 [Hyphomonadaceae bacterium]